MTQREIDLAWLGAILDGEGSVKINKRIRITRKAPNYIALFRISMTDKKTIDRIYSIAKIGFFPKPRLPNPKLKARKTLYIWNSVGRQALNLLTELEPFSITKYEHIKLVQELYNISYERKKRGSPVPVETSIERERLFRRVKEINKQGSTLIPLPKLGSTQASWLAGLTDGEGSIIISKTKPNLKQKSKASTYSLQVKISMTHKPTMDFLETIAPSTQKLSPRNNKANWKVAHRWALKGKAALIFLEQIEPYMTTKKVNVSVAREFMSIGPMQGCRRKGVSQEILQKREQSYWQMRDLNTGYRREAWDV